MFFTHVRADGSVFFFYPHRDHGSVEVTGSFSGWSTPGLPLARADHGWIGEIGPIPEGDLEYRFVADGRWVDDPLNIDRRGDNGLLHRGAGRGLSRHLRFHSPALGEERGYVVHLPPGWTSGRRFPVIYLLHGALDWERTWLEKGALASTMERARAEGAVGEVIVVMPADHGGLFRGDTRFADYLARDVVGHVDFELPTLADARFRALDGLSTGGFTSIALGAWRPDVFRSVGAMSGSFDGRTFEAIRGHAGGMRAGGQRYRISCGRYEPHCDDARAVVRALHEAGVPAEHAEGAGGHEWPTWRHALWGHLAFHWGNLRS